LNYADEVKLSIYPLGCWQRNSTYRFCFTIKNHTIQNESGMLHLPATVFNQLWRAFYLNQAAFTPTSSPVLILFTSTR